jgi:hypothetical protein
MNGRVLKRKPNRTYDANTRPLACRVDPDTRKEVEEYAKETKVYLAEALRQLIELGLETARLCKSSIPLHKPSIRSGVYSEWMNFNLGNSVKYIWRAGDKGSIIEDLKKARWYLDREIQRLEKK